MVEKKHSGHVRLGLMVPTSSSIGACVHIIAENPNEDKEIKFCLLVSRIRDQK